MEVNDLKVREKVTSVTRNGLHSKHGSSTHSKMAKRRHKKAWKGSTPPKALSLIEKSASSSSTMSHMLSPEGKNQVEARVLPIDFSPHPCSGVICGRGKVQTNTPGNQCPQSVAEGCMPKYLLAQSKSKKSLIVS
jgi:hypothetical protein